MLRAFTFSKKFMMALLLVLVAVAAYVYMSRYNSSQVEPAIRPEGGPKDMTTILLEAGSKLLQSNEPLKGTDIYFVGFHPMEDDPRHQMEAHHYCKQLNDDFAQCLLYDGSTKNANLTGVEYIISEKLYKQLPGEERKYWHPHNYEILSGMLIAPGLPSFAEKQLMKKKMNSYGKTFHLWRAKCWEGEKPYLDTLPKGEAILAWSFNHDGETKSELMKTRDKSMSVCVEQKKKERMELVKEAHPQAGVNHLALKFKHPVQSIPGVVDKKEVKQQKPQ